MTVSEAKELECFEEFYTLKKLLHRDRIRFEPPIMAVVKDIWQAHARQLGPRMTRSAYLALFGRIQLGAVPT